MINLKVDVMSTMVEGIQGSNDIKKTLDTNSFLSVLDFKIENDGVTELKNNKDEVNGNVAEFLSKLISSFSNEDKEILRDNPEMGILNEISYSSDNINNLVEEALTKEEIEFLTNKINILDEFNNKTFNISGDINKESVEIVENVASLTDIEVKDINSDIELRKIVTKMNYEDNLIKNSVDIILKEALIEAGGKGQALIDSEEKEIINVDSDISLNVSLDDGIEEVKIKEGTNDNGNLIKDKTTIVQLIKEFIDSKQEASNKINEVIELSSNKDISFAFNNKDSVEDSIENQINILNSMNLVNSNIENIKIEATVPQVIRQEYVSQDMVQAIKYINNNNIEALTVKMNPKDLGELTISLISNNELKKCIIQVKDENTLQLIKSHIAEIKEHLTSLDIPIKEIEVDVKTNNGNDFSDNFKEQFDDRNKKDNKNQKNTEVINENNIKKITEKDNNIDLVI